MGVDRPGETPGHRVVTSDAAAWLPGSAQYGIARVGGAVEQGHPLLYLVGGEDLAVDAVQPVGVHAPLDIAHLLQRVAEVHHSPRAEHDVEIEFLAQALPQFEREVVETRRLVTQVIGAHDGRVAAGVAAAQVSLLDDRHIGDAVLFCQVVRRRQAVTATAHDHRVISLPGSGITPGPGPVFVVATGVSEQAQERVFFHGFSVLIAGRIGP